MLILNRLKGQKVIIGDGDDAITITVLSVGVGKARLGVVAPDHVSVDREEVRAAREREQYPHPQPYREGSDR